MEHTSAFRVWHGVQICIVVASRSNDGFEYHCEEGFYAKHYLGVIRSNKTVLLRFRHVSSWKWYPHSQTRSWKTHGSAKALGSYLRRPTPLDSFSRSQQIELSALLIVYRDASGLRRLAKWKLEESAEHVHNLGRRIGNHGH